MRNLRKSSLSLLFSTLKEITKKLQNLRKFGDFVVFPYLVSYEIVVVGMGPLILVPKKQLFSDKTDNFDISLLKPKRTTLIF